MTVVLILYESAPSSSVTTKNDTQFSLLQAIFDHTFKTWLMNVLVKYIVNVRNPKLTQYEVWVSYLSFAFSFIYLHGILVYSSSLKKDVLICSASGHLFLSNALLCLFLRITYRFVVGHLEFCLISAAWPSSPCIRCKVCYGLQMKQYLENFIKRAMCF